MEILDYRLLLILAPILLILSWGIKIARPTHKRLIERLVRYQKLAQPVSMDHTGGRPHVSGKHHSAND